jgi:hypothetical protein
MLQDVLALLPVFRPVDGDRLFKIPRNVVELTILTILFEL